MSCVLYFDRFLLCNVMSLLVCVLMALPEGAMGWAEIQTNTWHLQEELWHYQVFLTCFLQVHSVGVALITQLRTCVIKIVTFKGGRPMWYKGFSIS